jgi:3-phosphoshikimate 1-carboxyvinyltransferase
MIVTISNKLKVTEIQAPASKSYAQRSLFAACLSEDQCLLKNLGSSDDVQHIRAIIEQLGAKLETKVEGTLVSPRFKDVRRILDCGESGLGIRLTTSIATSFGGEFTINGSGSLTQRPMNDFATFLPHLGIDFSAEAGFVPLNVKGQLMGGNLSIDGSLSSQFLSGLLMALPLAENDSTIKVRELKSKPYIDMTLNLLADFGIQIENYDYKTFTIKGNQKYKAPLTYSIECDWSGAAFWIVYGAIASPILIKGLNKTSSQADRAIMDVLEQSKATFNWENNNLVIQPSLLIPFHFDATDCPDLFPILTSFAAAIKGQSSIKGVSRLKFKESDRAAAIQKEFSKLGLTTEIQEDTMIINGTGGLIGGQVSSHNDHRIAMSLAIAAFICDNDVVISNAESVNKSYPEFWNQCPNQIIKSE